MTAVLPVVGVRPLPERDLDEVLARGEDDVRRWVGSRLLITGGTGFVGRWLVSSLLRAEDRWGLGLQLTLVTRDPGRAPQHRAVTVVGADVRQLPEMGRHDAVVAGAAASAATPGSADADPASIAASIVADAQHAVRAATGGRLLLLSSGAVYGRGPTGPVAEHDSFAPDPTDPGTAYGQAKRLAETLAAVATAAGKTEAVSARIFTLLGPGLPLDAHFAAGNVLRDVLAQQPIVLRGDGTAVRSYLDAGDLVVWLWRLLAAGQPGQAYNVGSPEPVTIRGLAEQAARLAQPPVPVVVEGRPGLASCYLPDVRRAADQLGLAAWTSLPEALSRTLAWSRS
jgi:dTDP-glucose 4,6-dehydratase